jgi:serine/threonine protein kinase
MEATSGDTLARERLHSGPLSLTHAVSATRDLARALAAVHRRQLVHGAIGLDSVRITSDGARLGGVGRSLEGSVRGDLDALGEVMWALFSGEVEGGSLQPLSKVRRGVTPTLDALFASMRAPDPRDRPQRAEAILSALDAVPTRRRNPLASIVDVGLHDARPRRAVVWLVVGAAVLLLAALLQSRS